MHAMWNLSSLTRLNLRSLTRLNLHPLQWEYGVLTPELPGKFFFFWLGGMWDLSPPKWKKVKSLSCVQLFVTPWTVAHQAPPSKEFSRQEYWSGLTFPSPGDLPDPGIESGSPILQADALLSEPPGKQFSNQASNLYSCSGSMKF